ncbi:MAG: hypothetical protein IPM29_11450 [Planctomycetes bacterium]|nr:hypothetical protein [Planctomycetota bacterium]
MSSPTHRPRELLALEGRRGSLRKLAQSLRDEGHRVDLVHALDELRDAFFHSGGHDALLLGPDLPAGLARRAIDCLAAIDDALRILSFGRCGADNARVRRIHSFHPSSRAALGAVLAMIAERDPDDPA